MQISASFRSAGLLLMGSALLLSACSVHESRNGNGKNVDVKTPLGTISVKENGADDKNKSVDIHTPFGGMQVRTDDVQAQDTGLTVYPGSRLAPRSEHDDSQANVNISTGWFGIKVVALKYESDDSPDKLLGYYKKDLARYGKVLQCKGGSDVSGAPAPAEDSPELSCSEDRKVHVRNHSDIHNINIADPNTIELKTGTKTRQRIVAIKPHGNGSSFDLVYVQTQDSSETM